MRALWVGVENDMVVSRTLWPCPNRVLNAPENLLNVLGLTSLNGQDCGVSSMDDLALGLNSMLEKASWNADGKARWRCSSQRFNLDRKYMKGARYTHSCHSQCDIIIVKLIAQCRRSLGRR